MQPRIAMSFAAFPQPPGRRQCLLDVAGLLSRKGVAGWGPTMAKAVVVSCDTEPLQMGTEAILTGRPAAQIVAKALNGTFEETAAGILVTEGTEIRGVGKFLIPNSTAPATPHAGELVLAFEMKVLRAFASIAEIDATRGERSLAQAMHEQGVELRDVAKSVVFLFVRSFLQGTLLRDPQSGNVGLASIGDARIAALCDFGSVNEKFPPQWRNWVVRVAMQAYSGEAGIEDLKNSLVELALAAEGWTDERVRTLIPELDRYVAEIQLRVATSGSIIDVISSTVELLYNKWPLQTDVRDFCEALRAVSREWNQHLEDSDRQELATLVFMTDIPALAAEAPDLFEVPADVTLRCRTVRGLVKEPTPAETYATLETLGEPDSWFSDEGSVPEGATFYRLADGEWSERTLQREVKLGGKSLSFTDNTALVLNLRHEGYFRVVESDKTVHYLTLKHYRQLG